MCGIVGYLGDAENGLARVMSAMAAILYRAPDSTGLAVFGDRDSPLRIRKAVGSVRELAEALDARGAYPESLRRLPFLPGDDESELLGLQRRILEFEDLPTGAWEAARQGHAAPPTFRALLDDQSCVHIGAGQPGRPLTPIPLCFSGLAGLHRGIDAIGRQYDLPAPVLRAIVRRAIFAAAAHRKERGQTVPDKLSERFERLFEAATAADERAGAEDTEVLALLAEADATLPGDFDPDGVRWVFRLLDGALLARLLAAPRAGEAVGRRLREDWANGEARWLDLYNAEKFANVYGRAAAAALSILQEERVLPAVTADDSPEGRALARLIVPGVTDAATLRYLLPPLIAHGRWAQQSAVSARNAHPFLDASGTRALALNGIFDGETEEEVQRYLTQVSQSPFRSENSSEYLALLWGHFYWVLSTDQWRFEGITARVDGEFEGFQVGSQSVDYPVYHQTRGVSHADLDQAAFREAVRAMVRRGGEVAAIGMSAISPGRLYVASHERPVFLVRRPDRDEFMVVSDTNAALGLFSESEVREARAAIEVLRQRAASRGADRAVSASEEADIRRRFQVEVLPLEGAGQLACVAPEFRRGILRRNVEVSNFDGAPSEREPFRTILDPVQTERDLYHSFYERHLNEIPERLSDLLEHYFPEGTRAPLLGFNERLIQRRFGPRLEALRRVVLVGTGSSHNLALAACAQLNRWMPEIEILALRPYEVLDVGREITPDRDLVVLLSWSSTTGDLVQFARELVSRQTAVVAITEKGYADMALLARRSAGVILARTGEEVTVSSVKSGPCMLVVLYLLGLWLARQLGRNVEGGVARRRLSTAIEKIDRMLHDGLSHDFARALAEKAGPVDACTIVATDQGIARELSLKLEQNCWNVSSRILDYQDVDLIPESWDQTGQLVLVVATRREQLQEALDVMARLKERSIPFWAVTAGRSRWREVKVLSGGQCVSLPRAGDRFQPLLDGIFFTALAYDYSRALGWTEEVAPRNLTKSVTIAGSRPRAAESPSRELRRLQDLNEALRRHPREQPHGETAWEKDAGGTEEGKHYRQLRRIAEALAAKGEDLPAWLAPRQEVDWERLVIAVSDGISDRGEILVVCLDRASLATAQAVAPLFAPHLDRNVRVVPWRDSLARTPEDAVLLYTWSQLTTTEARSRIEQRPSKGIPFLCVAPELTECPLSPSEASLGYVSVASGSAAAAFIPHFAVLSTLLIRIALGYRPESGSALREHFRHAETVITAVLGDSRLLTDARAAMQENSRYRKAFLVGPPAGNGSNWVQKIAAGPLPITRFLPFGESVHGPLVAVDPRIEKKQVALLPRAELTRRYSAKQVAAWERRYLGGQDTDAFLQNPRQGDPSLRCVADAWYLPVLRPDYDCSQDVLTFVDATSARFLHPALDELGVYGARHARIVVLTQEAFLHLPEGRALLKYPVSRLLRLPSLETTRGPMAIPEALLPFAHDALAVAMAHA